MPTPTKSNNSPPSGRQLPNNFRYSLRSRRQQISTVPPVDNSTNSISRDVESLSSDLSTVSPVIPSEDVENLFSEGANLPSVISTPSVMSVYDHVVQTLDTADPAHVATNLCYVQVNNTSEPAHVAIPSLSPSLSFPDSVEPELITSVPESPLNRIILSPSDMNLLRSTCPEASITSDFVFPQEYPVQTFPQRSDEPPSDTDYYFTVTLPIHQAQAFKKFLTRHLLREPLFESATPSWTTFPARLTPDMEAKVREWVREEEIPDIMDLQRYPSERSSVHLATFPCGLTPQMDSILFHSYRERFPDHLRVQDIDSIQPVGSADPSNHNYFADPGQSTYQ